MNDDTRATGPADGELPSKSQRKRDMLELQKLGEALSRLPGKTLAEIELPDNLREAIDAARRIHQRGALRRQLQYVGRVMRSIDADNIRDQLAAVQAKNREVTEHHHRLEAIRQQLIEGGDQAVSTFIEEVPGADRHLLRQLVRAARTEQQQGKNSKSFRALFRYLRDLDGS